MLRTFLTYASMLTVLTGCQVKSEPADRAADPDTASPSAQAPSDPTSEDTGPSPDDGEPTHTVLAVGSGGGLIAPDGETMVAAGTALTLNLYAADGYALSSVSGTCGGTLDGTQFTTDPVENDCSVLAVFEEIPAAPYCSGIPEEMADLVVCDPDLHLDTWSDGASYGTTDLRIEAGTVLSLPFTANAIGQSGVVEITNNMPGLVASGMSWRGWFSETPGGDMVHDSPYCQMRSPNPNPLQKNWTQSEPGPWDCPLGQVERTLYFNMEVRCFADSSDICTPGERHPENYWVGVWARPTD